MIFHLAAQPYVLRSYENPIETTVPNIMGLANLLEACRGLKIKAILNVTTDKCYENLEQNIPFKESIAEVEYFILRIGMLRNYFTNLYFQSFFFKI